MRLRAGEIQQRGAETFLRQHAKVNLQAALEQDAGLGFARGRDFDHVRECRELLHDRAGMCRGCQQVEIAYRFAPAAKAACNLELLDHPAFAQMRDQPLCGSRSLYVRNPLGRIISARQRFENLLFDLAAEALKFAKAPGPGLTLEAILALDVQVVDQQLEPLGTKAGNVS
jgi:hypothetical protein